MIFFNSWTRSFTTLRNPDKCTVVQRFCRQDSNINDYDSAPSSDSHRLGKQIAKTIKQK